MADLDKRDFIPMTEGQTQPDVAIDGLLKQRFGKDINTLDELYYTASIPALAALAYIG